MCQPKPLARCVNHAKKDLTKANEVLSKASKDHEDNKALLKKLHKQNNELTWQIGDQVPTESEDRELDAVGSDILRAGAKVRESKKAFDDASDNATAKEMLVDSTKTGRKELKTSPSTPENNVRLQVAEEMAQWQRDLKGRNDFSGYPVIDNDGKFSNQAVPIFRGVLNQSQTKYYAAQKIEMFSATRAKRAKAYITQTEKQAANKENRPEETAYFNRENVVAKENYKKTLVNQDLARRERIMYETQIKDMQEAIEKAKENSFDSSW